MLIHKIKIILALSLLLNYSMPAVVIAQSVEDEPLAVVDSGDIDLTLEAENQTNTNISELSGQEEDSAGFLNENQSEIENVAEIEGESGTNSLEAGEADALLETGDISAQSYIGNQANTNYSDASCGEDCAASSSEESAVENATSSDLAASSSEQSFSNDTSSEGASTTVDNLNNASTSNTAILDLNSGENSISGGADTVIKSGDIGIINIIVNYINTNFFGKGKEFFVNIFNTVARNIDLSGFGLANESASEACQTGNCQLNVNNSSTSTIENKIVIDANTGENLVSSSSGQALIQTGDINIVNDILNIANINVTGEDWFFAVVNIFGELKGDVILPAADLAATSTENAAAQTSAPDATSTMALAASQASPLDKQLIVANENAAEVLNEIAINAETGGNAIASSAESYIYSGNASINLNTFNLINYNISGNTWKFARVNVFGNWQGFIQGLPPEYSYLEDESGITIYNSFLDNYYIDSAYAQMLINNENIASTTNQIEINAITGNNSILHSGDAASILSGDIDITNNLLNFINSNFSGQNWEFSMVNVFGDWQGNLAFGQPELWIVESFDSDGQVQPGEYITYTFLFGNNGDAPANNVVVRDSINKSLVGVADSGAGDDTGNQVVWGLGDLPPNSQGSISYVVKVEEDLPYGESRIANEVVIAADENERNYENNVSSGLILANRVPSSGGGTAGDYNIQALSTGVGGHPSLSIIKTNNANKELRPGDVVDYKIRIKNTGSINAQEVLVLDVLSNQDTQEEINREFWDLETVYAGEEVLIEYSLQIKDSIKSGTYNNEAIVEGYNKTAGKFISAIASSKIKVFNDDVKIEEEVAVLGEVGEPELIAKKDWPQGVLSPGQAIEYNVVVKNIGNLAAYDVNLQEILPPQLVFVDNNLSGQTFYLGDFEPGIEKSLPFKVRVLDDAQAGQFETATIISASNYPDLELKSSLVIERIQVLAASGFEFKEFFLVALIAFLLALPGLILRFRRFKIGKKAQTALN